MLVKRNPPNHIFGYQNASFEHELLREIGKPHLSNKSHRLILAASLFSIYKEKTIITIKYFAKLLLNSRCLKFLKGKKVIIATDINSNGYFHWYLDVLTRLIYINDSHNHTLLLPLNLKKSSFINESLKHLEIKHCFVDPGTILLDAEVITINFDYPSGNYDPEIINNLRRRLCIIKKISERIVYISRTKALRRRMFNENIFIDKLIEAGIEVVCCEDMNFDQTREYFSDVKLLIAQHGAGLTNMLFMQPNSKVIEIRNLGDEHNNCYFSLASSLSIDYEYCTTKEVNNHNDDVNFEYSSLLRHLKNI